MCLEEFFFSGTLKKSVWVYYHVILCRNGESRQRPQKSHGDRIISNHVQLYSTHRHKRNAMQLSIIPTKKRPHLLLFLRLIDICTIFFSSFEYFYNQFIECYKCIHCAHNLSNSSSNSGHANMNSNWIDFVFNFL